MYKGDTADYDEEMLIFDALNVAARSEDRELAHFLINPNALGVLAIITRKSMTVGEISRSLALPLATCYKLVEQMVNFGLAARTSTVRANRTRAAKYISSLKTVSFFMHDCTVEITIVWKNGNKETFRHAFVPVDYQTEVEASN
jgi:predicted transcriptional regulator